MILTPTTWNGNAINDGTNFVARFLGMSGGGPHGVNVNFTARQGQPPSYSSKTQRERILQIVVLMKGTISTQRETLKTYFAPDDDSGELTLVATDDSANTWFVKGVAKEVPNIDGRIFFVNIAVSDPVWKRVTEVTDTWTVASSGSTRGITNSLGNLPAYPKYQIKPLIAKTGDYSWLAFITLRNPSTRAFTNYPFDLCSDAFDTAAEVTATRMQADGDDLRVFIDGIEQNRWLDGINTTTTKVWCNINLSAGQSATLGTSIAGSGSITSIVASTSISGFPTSGILLIDSEVFTYTSKSDSIKTFLGVTRAAKFTAMAAHTGGSATIYWLEHDIWLKWGNSAATAPTTDDTKKPIFNLASSTNTSWVYADFRDGDASQSGIWSNGGTDVYTGNQDSSADPAVEMGVGHTAQIILGENKYWQLYNPSGITVWTFANGEKYKSGGWWTTAALQRSTDGSAWTTEFNIAAPSALTTWEAWSDAARTLGATAYYIRMLAFQSGSGVAVPGMAFEVADVTLTLASAGIPVVTRGARNSLYNLNAVLANTTTNESITLVFAMSLNQTLEIDTELHTATYLADNSPAYSAISFSTVRDDWLKLLAGSNTLSYTEAGMAVNGVEVKTIYKSRNN